MPELKFRTPPFLRIHAILFRLPGEGVRDVPARRGAPGKKRAGTRNSFRAPPIYVKRLSAAFCIPLCRLWCDKVIFCIEEEKEVCSKVKRNRCRMFRSSPLCSDRHAPFPFIRGFLGLLGCVVVSRYHLLMVVGYTGNLKAL